MHVNAQYKCAQNTLMQSLQCGHILKKEIRQADSQPTPTSHIKYKQGKS